MDLRLPVSDPLRSLPFYSGGLGFEATRRIATGSELACVELARGDARITLVRDEPAAITEVVQQGGPWILIADVATLRRVHLALEFANIPTEEVAVDGGVGFLASDPDGHRFLVAAESAHRRIWTRGAPAAAATR